MCLSVMYKCVNAIVCQCKMDLIVCVSEICLYYKSGGAPLQLHCNTKGVATSMKMKG